MSRKLPSTLLLLAVILLAGSARKLHHITAKKQPANLTFPTAKSQLPKPVAPVTHPMVRSEKVSDPLNSSEETEGLPATDETVALKQFIFGPIELGEGEKKSTMVVMYDTGSPTLWVNGVSCPSCSDEFGMAKGYDCSDSMSCKDTGVKEFLQYGIGSTEMTYIDDTITISGDLTAKKFRLGLATKVTDSADLAEVNGICGLGFAEPGVPTVIDSLKEQNQIEEKIFSLLISYDDSDSSSLVVGGVEPDFMDTTKTWYNFKLLTGAREWLTKLDRAEVLVSTAGNNNNFLSQKNNIALFDSGTSHLLFNQATVNNMMAEAAKMNSKCSLQEDWAFICSASTAKLQESGQLDKMSDLELVDALFPTLNFTIQGQSFTLEPRYYIHQCQGEGDLVECLFLVGNMDMELNIFGDPMFRKYYVVFYQDNNSIELFHRPTQIIPPLAIKRSTTTTETASSRGWKYSMFGLLGALAFTGVSKLINKHLNRANEHQILPE